MDEWSDIDVCLVYDGSDERLDRGKWMDKVYETYQHKIDPISLNIGSAGPESSWDIAFLLHSLHQDSKLLCGTDIRSLIVPPSKHKLLLSSCWVAFSSVRRIYSIERQHPIPDVLPPPDLNKLQSMPCGNKLWQIYAAAIHLLRAILLVEKDELCISRQVLYQKLESYGENDLASICRDAVELRLNSPRFGEFDKESPTLKRLIQEIPRLIIRLIQCDRWYNRILRPFASLRAQHALVGDGCWVTGKS